MEVNEYVHFKLQHPIWNGPDVGPFQIASKPKPNHGELNVVHKILSTSLIVSYVNKGFVYYQKVKNEEIIGQIVGISQATQSKSKTPKTRSVRCKCNCITVVLDRT